MEEVSQKLCIKLPYPLNLEPGTCGVLIPYAIRTPSHFDEVKKHISNYYCQMVFI